MVEELTSEKFDDFVKENRVVVDFFADWCGPCQQLGPVVEEVSKEVKDKVKIGKVNVETEQGLAQRFQVMSIPTLLFFKDGEQVHRTQGAISKEDLLDSIDEHLGK
ncbi:thioredoxin [Candidatus Pacearchaeota archaeon]|jgi:thioredoxin 1|nr:thioredoxin [Candidatus Pacearchaeota archaeon]|tara:strand:+ start:242 stop:559 length:318 start_codon:yes stop_codon:yes gene_type:complete